MEMLSLPFLRPLAPYWHVLIRLAVGAVMAVNGYGKLTGPGAEGFAGMMLEGWPAATFFGWVVIGVELLGGLLLILGALSRISAVLIAFVMFMAMLIAKGFGISAMSTDAGGATVDWLLLAGALAIAFAGPGVFSVDRYLGIEDAEG